MKDVMASLPEVIKEYKGYNLLIPTATDVQLNPFYKFHVEEVAVGCKGNDGWNRGLDGARRSIRRRSWNNV